MQKILKTIHSERIYIGLLIIIILVNILSNTQAKKLAYKTQQINIEAFEGISEKDLAHKLITSKWLFMISLLFILTAFFSFLFGLYILGKYILLKFIRKKEPIPILSKTIICPWGIRDIFRAIILVLFFTYSAVCGLAIVGMLIRKNLLLLQLGVLDIIAFSVLIYFIKNIYKQDLAILGLNIKNMRPSIFWAIVSYIGFIPLLLGVLLINNLIMELIKYKPSIPPVFGFVWKENRPWVLIIFTFQVGVVAPFVEEFFFRGFLYNALKKYLKIMPAAVITTLFFALSHQEVSHFIPIIFIGFLLVYIYEKTNSLYTAFFIHSIHNLSTTFLLLLIKSLLTK